MHGGVLLLGVVEKIMGGKKKKGRREESASDVDSSLPGSDSKKSKRKQKEFSDDFEDDLSALASEMGINNAASDTPETLPQADTVVETIRHDKPPLGAVKTAKKKQKEGSEPDVEPFTATSDAPESPSEVRTKSTNKVVDRDEGACIVLDDNQKENEGDEDKKKKKKKKKKPLEEEKKSKGPSKSVISKIKKVQAALEEEKKRREEEAIMAQRAEEERERARAEKLRLEKERKEKQKQKEKEKKMRKKLEGKPITKKEREAEARRLAHLADLQEQGIVVPEKGQGGEKKVVYGSRQRKKRSEAAKSDKHEQTGESKVDVNQASKSEDVEAGASDLVLEGEEALESWEDLDTNENSENEEAVSSEGDSKDAPAAGNPSSEEAEDEETSSDSSSSSSEEEDDPKLRIRKRRARHTNERSLDSLRSPVVCVLGHVDTGKTKILDKIRRTNVQDGEAGGITQQIGATFVPKEAIQEQTKMLKEFSKGEINLPGLLIIDTPGHESFRNLRTRGSSMCDLAILVVDIMHGLEPQTLESLSLLLKGKTPFIIALNKIDRLFDWHRNPSAGIRDTLKRQKPNTRAEFDERVKQVSTEFAEQGLNVALFWDKVDFTDYVALVPTSAITGDGMADLIALLVEYSLGNLAQSLMLSMEIEAMVMEVKVIAGLGTTIDVILRNGVLKEGDALVLMGNDGPFVATVRALLMPQPLRELRVKNAYISHKAVVAAQGIKVTAKGELEKALPGTNILVAKRSRPDEIEVLKEEAANAMKTVLNSIKMQERGVYVQASTLGSLEALLDFLTQSSIPYSGISIGPVHKKDVMKASVMLEHDPQWAVILAFDVRIEREAQEMADGLGVKIFSADIIYHLFDSFLKHREELREKNRQQYQSVAVFPCKLRVLPNCIFNSRDPIIVGVLVEAGLIKPGTPLTVPSKNFTDIGVVTSLEVNHKPVEICRKGVEVCVKIEPVGGEAPRLYGRHFDHTDIVVSKITRESIDAVKNYFREDLLKADWQLMIELKKMFQIM